MGTWQGFLLWLVGVGGVTFGAAWGRRRGARRAVAAIRSAYHLIPKRPGEVGNWQVIKPGSVSAPCCPAHGGIRGEHQ